MLILQLKPQDQNKQNSQRFRKLRRKEAIKLG